MQELKELSIEEMALLRGGGGSDKKDDHKKRRHDHDGHRDHKFVKHHDHRDKDKDKDRKHC